MMGKAVLKTPASGNIGPSVYDGLSDDLVRSYGTLLATTLSDEHSFVLAKLSDGTVLTFRYDTTDSTVHIGRLVKKNKKQCYRG